MKFEFQIAGNGKAIELGILNLLIWLIIFLYMLTISISTGLLLFFLSTGRALYSLDYNTLPVSIVAHIFSHSVIIFYACLCVFATQKVYIFM